ncbi:DUF2283 domain-containing protein [Microtetraspora fusca]|uniref:DUF2283 domain-containing protein n=1 Tax=Microtetraspora fusca TaxID=1997 RepID=UPI000A0217AD
MWKAPDQRVRGQGPCLCPDKSGILLTPLLTGDRMSLEEHPGTWTYDPQAGAAYVSLHGPIPPGGVAEMVTVDSPMVNLDLDENGRVIGIEILATWP